jgi:hypothetical protein
VFLLGIRLFQNEFDLLKQEASSAKALVVSRMSAVPFSSKPANQYYIPKQDRVFLSLTTYNSSSVRQHQIVKDASIVSAIALNIFSVEGAG